jgi:rRNA maturation endonuclease Nob1
MIGRRETIAITESVIVQLGRTCTVCAKTFTVRENESACPDCSSRVLVIGPESE